jgi:hypothetical protein
MRRVLLLAGLLASLAFTATAGEKGKGTKVTLDDVSSTTPASWKAIKLPRESMRFAQFRLSNAEGDKEVAEVVIFKLGGGTKANIARWKAQFAPPKGKTTDDVAKVSEIKIGGHKATQLDIRGTYKAPPFDPTYKGKMLEGFRLIAIQLEGPDNPYQIKLLGPEKTVEKHKKEFETWLKGFKK